jgi:hypothetical protein
LLQHSRGSDVQNSIFAEESLTNQETVALESSVPDRPDYLYPVQIVRFGSDLALVALGSEVVVDYALRRGPDSRASRRAGYSNDYRNYIASRRVLEEGGYEASNCAWKPDLEERIVSKVHELYERLEP